MNKPPEIFNSIKRGNLLLVLLPCIVSDIFEIPQSPTVLQRMFDGIIDGHFDNFIAMFFVFFVLQLNLFGYIPKSTYTFIQFQYG